MRKVAKLLAIVLALTMFLTACGSKTPSNAPEAGEKLPEETGDITLRVSWWGGDSRHEATLKAIEKFRDAYPNVKIEAEYGGWTGWQEKVTTQIAGRTAPDVMQVNWNWLWIFSKDGNGFFDLNRVNDIINLNNYDPALLSQTTINGKLNALPVGIGGKVFYWNEDAYKTAGVPIPKTFDDLFAAAPVFKQKLGNDYYPFDLDQYNAFLMAIYYLEQKTGRPFINNQTNEIYYTKAELEEAFNFYLKMASEGVVPTMEVRGAAGNVPVDQTPGWINGKYGGTYEWDSSIAKFQQALANNQKLVAGEFLTGLGSNPSALAKVSMGFAINKDTKYPQTAAKFLEFLLAEESAEIIGTQRGIPVNKGALNVLESKGMLKGLTYEGNTIVKKFLGQGISPYFENAELQNLYRTVMEELGYGTSTPGQAADKLLKDGNRLLKEVSQ